MTPSTPNKLTLNQQTANMSRHQQLQHEGGEQIEIPQQDNGIKKTAFVYGKVLSFDQEESHTIAVRRAEHEIHLLSPQLKRRRSWRGRVKMSC